MNDSETPAHVRPEPEAPAPGPAVVTGISATALSLVALYAAVILLPFLGSARSLTPHEVMVTHPAQRLLETGEWIIPRYAGGWWLDKPPLVNWLTAGVLAAAGGFSEFAVRLPAALSGIGLAVLLAVLAGRFYGPRVGLLAGLVQASCVWVYMQARLGEIDIPFTLLLAGAHGVLLWRWGSAAPTSATGGGRNEAIDLPLVAAALFHLLVALAVLAKGALAVVVVGCTVLATCLLRRSWRPLRSVVWTPGVAVFVVVAVGWHIAAYRIAGDEALRQWGYNGLLRFFGLHHLGSKSFLFYFWTIPWLMLPWTVALVLGARVLKRELRGPQAAAHQFLWAWLLGGLAFFTICFFKHKHYVLPVLPPLSILTAVVIDAHLAWKGRAARVFYTIVFAVAALAYGVTSGYVMPRQDHRRATVEFVRRATSGVPAGEPLYVLGLMQSSAYPYIAHEPCIYLDPPQASTLGITKLEEHIAVTLGLIDKALEERGGRPMWVLSLRQYLDVAARGGLRFEPVDAEPVRPKHPAPETMILGRLARGE